MCLYLLNKRVQICRYKDHKEERKYLDIVGSSDSSNNPTESLEVVLKLPYASHTSQVAFMVLWQINLFANMIIMLHKLRF